MYVNDELFYRCYTFWNHIHSKAQRKNDIHAHTLFCIVGVAIGESHIIFIWKQFTHLTEI